MFDTECVASISSIEVQKQSSGIIPCDFCNTPFEKTGQRKSYCSIKCNKRAANKAYRHRLLVAKQITINCKRCNNPFVQKRIDQFYCSFECCRKHAYEKKRVSFPLLVCEYEECRKEFTPSAKNQRYCSKKCYKIILDKSRRMVHDPIDCARCEASFIPVNNFQKFCSDDCRAPTKIRPMVACLQCTTPFSQRNIRHRFCSFHCFKQNSYHNNPKIECEWCKSLFKPVNPAHKFCSRPCRDFHTAAKISEAWKETRAKIIAAIIPIKCGWCETPFKPLKKHNKYCSTYCGKKANNSKVFKRLGHRPTVNV